MRGSLALLALFSLSSASGAAAQMETARVYVSSPIPSCATWSSARKAGSAVHLEFWVLGFVSGFNFYSPDSGGDIAPDVQPNALLSWIDQHCQAKPTDNILHGASRLVWELRKRAAAK